MEPNYSTKTQASVRSGRLNLLPSMRNDQCTLVRPSLQTTGYTHDRGAIDSGASLHDEGERSEGLPYGSGTFTNDVRGSHGTDTDPFSGPAEPVQYPEGCDSPSDRSWYLIGHADGVMKVHANMMPMIDQVIEKASRC